MTVYLITAAGFYTYRMFQVGELLHSGQTTLGPMLRYLFWTILPSILWPCVVLVFIVDTIERVVTSRR